MGLPTFVIEKRRKQLAEQQKAKQLSLIRSLNLNKGVDPDIASAVARTIMPVKQPAYKRPPSVQKAAEKNRSQLEAFSSFCKELGEKEADVALAWMIANPAITAPIIGPRTLDQLQGSLRAVELKLDEGSLAKLDEIFPGPGGPAPEAYAW